MSGKKQRGLGRGLSALMADVAEDRERSSAKRAPDHFVPTEKVFPNPDQPRRTFDMALLNDLSNSIREKGIIQPLIVRNRPGVEDTYEIVAGERRWRAAQQAQLHEIPVIVREFTDLEVLEVAIIENIQRADLNPVDEAAGYSQLMERFGHTQEKLAEALGKSRSYIANSMRLLQLPESVLVFLQDGRLSTGHARALITSDDPETLARKVIAKNLSVRETEKLAKTELPKKVNVRTRQVTGEKDADTRALEGDLSANLGMKVNLAHKPGQEKGDITISYDNLEQLDNICRLLSATLQDESI